MNDTDLWDIKITMDCNCDEGDHPFNCVFCEEEMDKIVQMCAAGWFCAESMKLWSQATPGEREVALKTAWDLTDGSRKPTCRRDRIVISIWSLSRFSKSQTKRIGKLDIS